MGGRPLFLTPKRFIKICRWIEQGESASEACRLELVTYQGFRQHVKRNPKYQRRLKEAEETREEFLREYHIANIRKHAPRNVLASLWWLERRFPQNFALRNFVRNEGSTSSHLLIIIMKDSSAVTHGLHEYLKRDQRQPAANCRF